MLASEAYTCERVLILYTKRKRYNRKIPQSSEILLLFIFSEWDDSYESFAFLIIHNDEPSSVRMSIQPLASSQGLFGKEHTIMVFTKAVLFQFLLRDESANSFYTSVLEMYQFSVIFRTCSASVS